MAEYGTDEQDKNRSAAMLAYILLLAGPLFGGITALIGVVIAYVYRDDCPEWLQSHFQLQIRTFWIGLLFFIIATVTMLIIIGNLLLLIAIIWYLVRIIKGIRALNNQRPYPNPTSWGF
jgi:uncharacterized membrane protein